MSTPSGSRIRGALAFLAVSLATGVLFLSGLEAYLRIAWQNPYRDEQPDEIVRLLLHHAKTDHVLDRSLVDPRSPMTRLRTDDRSYILPSRQYETPDYTIAFFGSSTTECEAVSEQLRFPALVSTLLAQKGLKVNTLNVGRSGNTTHDSLNNLLNHVILDRPDVAVLMEAASDIGLLKSPLGYRHRMGRIMRMSDWLRWPGQVLSSHVYVVALVRKRLTSATIAPARRAIGPAMAQHVAASRDQYHERLVGFVRLCRAFGIEPVLMTQPLAPFRTELSPKWIDPTAQDVFNGIVRQIGAEEKVTVIDLVAYLREHVEGWDEPMKIFYDGVHATDFGSQKYAEYIAERLYQTVLTNP